MKKKYYFLWKIMKAQQNKLIETPPSCILSISALDSSFFCISLEILESIEILVFTQAKTPKLAV